jgi:hypothetical protein
LKFAENKEFGKARLEKPELDNKQNQMPLHAKKSALG